MDDRDSVRHGNHRAVQLDCPDDRTERSVEMTSAERVRDELAKYEHPLFGFEARETAGGVELIIRSKVADVLSPEYKITFAERGLQSRQISWTLQKLFFDCPTHYVV